MHRTRFERLYQVASSDLNGYGIMHGGRLLTIADETAFMSSRLHAGGICLTRAVHQAIFHSPAREGQTLKISSIVAYVGRTSLWIPVEVHLNEAQEPKLMEAVFVFTALDETGKPRQVEGIEAKSEKERLLQDRIRQLQLERLT